MVKCDLKRLQVSEPDRARRVDLLDQECKTTKITVLRTLMAKADSIQTQLGNADRGMENSGKSQAQIPIEKDKEKEVTVTERDGIADGLTS